MTAKTDYAYPEVLDRVRSNLVAATRLPVVIESMTLLGDTYPSLRLVWQSPNSKSFSIALVAAPRYVEAIFLADSYAGPLLRLMGDRVAEHPDDWTEQIREGLDRQIDVSVRIDNLPAMPMLFPPSPWRSLDIEARRRVSSRTTDEDRVDAWTSVAGIVLCMVMSALMPELAIDPESGAHEGGSVQSSSRGYERNPVNRYRSIEHYGWSCWSCDFDFADAYGSIGEDFIEVHHLNPLADLGHARRVNPITEMIPLCSNCHSMVHRESPPIHPVRLRSILGREPKKSELLQS